METPNPHTIVADSSGLISLLLADDQNHPAAEHYVTSLSAVTGTILLPTAVLTETVNVLGKKFGHAVAGDAGAQLVGNPAFALLVSPADTYTAALARFRSQPDSVSLTDCLVMTVADQHRTPAIFGFDAVFRKNGYQTPTLGR